MINNNVIFFNFSFIAIIIILFAGKSFADPLIFLNYKTINLFFHDIRLINFGIMTNIKYIFFNLLILDFGYLN